MYSAAGCATDVELLYACLPAAPGCSGQQRLLHQTYKGVLWTTNPPLAAQQTHTLSKAWSTRLTPTSIRGAGLGTRAFCTSSPCDSLALVMTAAARLCLCARLTGADVAVTRRQALIDTVVACLIMQVICIAYNSSAG